MLDHRRILESVLAQYRLPPEGVHGVPHWARVCENGRLLARRTGAVVPVVELFALLHDACRDTERHDPGHGSRASRLAEELRGRVFDLDDAAFTLLQTALEKHSAGLLQADPTIETCWDADRLDLGRIGIIPRGSRLCTDAARELSISQTGRAMQNEMPAALAAEWGWHGVGQPRAR